MKVVELVASLLAGAAVFLVISIALTELLGGIVPFVVVITVPIGLVAGLVVAAWAYVYLASLVYRQPRAQADQPR